MPWILYNHGKDKLYLTSKQRSAIVEKYYAELRLSPSDKLDRLIRSTPKQKQEVTDYIASYVTQRHDSDEIASIRHFNFVGTDAQQEVYELLWAFCELHPSYRLGIRENRAIFTPPRVDVYLPATFGDIFFLLHFETITKKFGHKEEYLQSAFEIKASDIIRITGTFENFIIYSKDNRLLQFSDIGEEANTSLASVYSSVLRK